PFDRFREAGGTTSGKGDWAWLQHTLACMNEGGRAAVVLDTGSVTRGSGSKNEDRERNIRKWFVDQDLIEGVLLLPENLFYNTTAAGVIVVLNAKKRSERRNTVVLVNASQSFLKSRPKNYLSDDAIKRLATAFTRGEPLAGEIAVISREDVQSADYNLSPSRWLTDDKEPDKSSVAALLERLRDLCAEERHADDTLLELLAPLEEGDGNAVAV
ncbi:MAG: SAM-dependent methyltransferase, partial [Candidatus Eremiobacteraeota bacterium]|nr:SAM-dependent methyltransferase [Candidatus Eremiobacteraeota bacterium]